MSPEAKNRKKREDVREDVRIEVPHYQQLHNWDCGLACTRMILGFHDKKADNFEDICKKLKFGDSVWTIDLANILHHYDITSHMCTITMGVDRGYSDKAFYKGSFAADEQRVNNLFKNAEDHGLKVENRSVPLSDILHHLSSGKVAIVLVDWNHLSCKWCRPLVRCISFPCICKCLNLYQGHFITVCGFNKSDKLIYYKNPSYREKLCCCSMKSFEAARHSYGTDEDILFIDSVPASDTQKLAQSS